MVAGLTVEALSGWLCGFQAVFRGQGHERVYVGGSGARALLDGRVAGLRDVDLFLDGEAARSDDARAELGRMVAVLGETEVVRAGVARLRDKRRADPELALPGRERHVIGVGTHVFPRTAPLPIVSLTVLRRGRDLELGGIFDIDAVYVVLDTQRPLLAQLVAPVVIDRFDGVVAWRARRPRVVHWEEVARCHARHGLRIARTLAGCGRGLDAATVDAYRAVRPGRAVDDADEVFRDLVKLLADPQWRAGLGLARELGGFVDDPAFAWLAEALARWDGGGLRGGARASEVDTVRGSGDGAREGDAGSEAAVVLARARRLLAGLGEAAEAPLERLARAVPSVFPFVEEIVGGAEIS